ncbi:hypothetical protein SLNWT_0339 [Streptomyces albus]|uniref:Uncharacterized protein n=1 Tax=Streptomyces albus (strain ATCC 21838 / DSM 41398 / FERM P-419 / JCM 4703 / NBRC 107858) TaxID=1081613 RepID=A0A0B5EMZ7_STRA4|nr:hypothetical protein SLNWT_0339 [Streptomyces albus]AOU75026.1 hypothetical protein SLNHY_0335 [Streptomyces albus]
MRDTRIAAPALLVHPSSRNLPDLVSGRRRPGSAPGTGAAAPCEDVSLLVGPVGGAACRR